MRLKASFENLPADETALPAGGMTCTLVHEMGREV